MWPSIFEFNWDAGHMIFFGVFYAVVIVIATSIVYAVARSIVDVFSEDAGGEENRAAHSHPTEKPIGG